MHSTYHGWKSAIRKIYPDAYFEGDRDICQAFWQESGRVVGVGEWDGSKGEVYRKDSDFELTWLNPGLVPELPVLLKRLEEGVASVSPQPMRAAQ